MKYRLPVLFLPIFFSMAVHAQTSSFDVQGHRGCRGLRPENTLPAFQHALALGVKTLELDVVISQDGQVVVSHEPYFHPDISSDAQGHPVLHKPSTYHMPYADILNFDVGKRGNPRFPEQVPMPAIKPLLQDVLTHTQAANVSYNIELKSSQAEVGKSQPDVATFCRLVAKVWEASGIPSTQLTIQSFDAAILQYWHQGRQLGTLPQAKLAWLIEPNENNDLAHQWALLGFMPDIWSPFYAQVTEERIQKCHQLGIRVIPWTVNERNDMLKMRALGCDGLITDYPDRAKELGLF